MKNSFNVILLLFVLCVFADGKEYELKYQMIPKSINCFINLYISNQRKGQVFTEINNIEIKTNSASFENNEVKYNTNIINKINEENIINKECVFQIENKSNHLEVKKITDVPFYVFAKMKDNIFAGQLFLEEKMVSVGDSWETVISNPLGGSDLVVSNRLIRVADNVATIYFSGKSPFRGYNVKTEEELMEIKRNIGSTFYMTIDQLSGHAEVSCSGVWVFDVKTGQILVSDQFFKINSLLRKDDTAPIESISDFFFSDVFMTLNYQYGY